MSAMRRLLALGAVASTGLAAAPAIAPADLEFFETRVRPVLEGQCYNCHSHEADKVRGGLLLDTRDSVLHGGNSGAAIVPGDPDNSLLIQAIRYLDEDLQMPPKGKKLPDQQIADLAEWIRRGAPDPRQRVALAQTSSGASNYGGAGKQFWSFQPVKSPAVPAVKDAAWARSPVDAFILQRLEGAGLTPNPQADRRTLIRRVSYDLTGLPPREAEVQAFLADESPDAFARVVDRLLASPHYGEHLARMWLDVARYADTKGDPARRDDPRYPHAWTFRDYVIDAFNADKPYSQFILEQLAADRLIAEAAKGRKDAKISIEQQATQAALGFLTVGNTFDGMRNDVINDQIDVTTKGFLGLTVSCARCHDHKFDPIPTRDYYSLHGVFANAVVPVELPLLRPAPITPELQEYLEKSAVLEAQAAVLREEFAAMRRAGGRDADQRRQLVRQQALVQRELGDLETTHPGAPARAMVVRDVPKPQDYPVLLRGEAENKGEVVPRRFLEVLAGSNRPTFRNGSGRLELARAIADAKNPLTARVIVNRIWQQVFGEGIVATPDDFGNMSAPPTHPELLDHLAATFVERGWSLKDLHRRLVLTATYQQSSSTNPAAVAVDPDNHLRWRASLRRLDFEQVHDGVLAIAGLLDLSEVGGKPVPIGSAEFVSRRAIYTWIDRRNPPELLTQFDFPNPNVPSGRRHDTIVPQQSLFLMNSPFVIESSRALVHQPAFTSLVENAARVRWIYEALFQRLPGERELSLCLDYVKKNPAGASLEAPQSTAFSEANTREARRQMRQMEAAQQFPNARRNAAFQAEPGAAAFPTREPVDVWTKLVHALLQTNEAMFVN